MRLQNIQNKIFLNWRTIIYSSSSSSPKVFFVSFGTNTLGSELIPCGIALWLPSTINIWGNLLKGKCFSMFTSFDNVDTAFGPFGVVVD